jgi:hypothetical protein
LIGLAGVLNREDSEELAQIGFAHSMPGRVDDVPLAA